MNRLLCLLLLAGLPLAGSIPLRESDSKRIEDNKNLARRVFSDIYGAGKINLVDEWYAQDFVDDSPGGGTGRELIKTAVLDFHKAIPDLHFEFEDVFATDDKVVVRYVAEGTQTGSYGEIQPTGKQVRVRGITIFQVLNGKIKTEWTEYDRLGLLRQIGLIP